MNDGDSEFQKSLFERNPHRKNFIEFLTHALKESNIQVPKQANVLEIGFHSPEQSSYYELRSLFPHAHIREVDIIKNKDNRTLSLPEETSVEWILGASGDARTVEAYADKQYNLMLFRNPDSLKMKDQLKIVIEEALKHLAQGGAFILITGEEEFNKEKNPEFEACMNAIQPIQGITTTVVHRPPNIPRTQDIFAEQTMIVIQKQDYA